MARSCALLCGINLLSPLFISMNSLLIGSSTFISTDIMGAEKAAKRSGCSLAIDLGVISPNISTSTVITTVLTVGPAPSPMQYVKSTVATDVQDMLTMLLPTRMELSSSSYRSASDIISFALLSPASA